MQRWSVDGAVLGGAVGGTVNAWLCYAEIPIAVEHATFKWHLMPAGCIHGAILAGMAWILGVTMAQRPAAKRFAVAIPLGWTAGYVSWIPLNWSAFERPWHESPLWPGSEGWLGGLLGPLQAFGLVALIYYLGVTFYLVRETRLAVQLVVAVAGGVVGSLWWWVTFEAWYLAVLHGAIWGICVALGAWIASQRSGQGAQGVA